MANNPPNPGSQEAINVPNVIQESTSDWQEHTAGDGRRYFYNKRTNLSSWEKPLELMTPLEKADASTVWKEFTNAEGKKFYYNKETKQSEWTIPNELKLARMQVNKEASRRSHSPISPTVNGAPSALPNHTSLTPETNFEIPNSHDVANADLDEASLQDIETIAHSGSERRQTQQRPHLPSDSAKHQWLQFPRTLPSHLLTKYNERLSRYAIKEIEIPHSLDWELATEVGLTSKIKRLLTQEFGDGHRVVHFTCHAWRNLFQIREPVYRELVLEFYSTVKFNQISTDIDDQSVFSFRLGGLYRKCSLRDLSWRLGLYTKLETTSIHFRDFLTYAHRSQPHQFRPAEFWATIANGAYDASQAVESRIRSPVHRLVHRLISTSLNHRRESKKVPMLDLFYLWCILTPGVLLNIPHAVALNLSRRVDMPYLSQEAMRCGRGSPICGGHFITRLARSYGLLTEPNVRTLLRYEPKNMGLTVLVAMRILHRTAGGGARIMDVDATEEQEESMADQPEQAAQPVRWGKRRRMHAPARVDEPVVDLRYISGRVDELDRTVAGLALYQDDLRQYQFRLQDQFQWMGTALTSLLAHHGITVPSPFPPPPPLYPSWGSRFTTHPPPRDNGAGTSGTQPDSNDEL